MASIKITKKHHKRLNNPFPSSQNSLPFIQGTLFFNSRTLPENQIYPIGNDFQLNWTSNDGGSISISHKSQHARPLWSTNPGQAFVSAAVAAEIVENFTETIGRPPELPHWIISGAVVGMQGGTDAVCRHLFFHYPNDDHVHSFSYQQFLVGTEILVVPVLDKGKKVVKAYFPAGESSSWEHIWTRKLYSKPGSEEEIEAPVGYPAIFIKHGSMVGETFLRNLSLLMNND